MSILPFDDRDGVIWVGTYNGGLSRFDPDRGTFSPVDLDREDSYSEERSQIWSLEDDRYGQLWVGTSAGLYRVDRATGAVTREDAVLSVHAGFRASEITARWPRGDPDWQCSEFGSGLFSHCFSARRQGAD